MNPRTSDGDAVAALNRVLNEVLDVVQDVKQARRKVPADHELHAEVDQLFDDVLGWGRRLIEEDEALGSSPLSSIPSTAGRTPPNLWPGSASDDEIRRVLVEHLERLAAQLTVALEEQVDPEAQAALGQIHRSVMGHVRALSA